MTLLKHLIPLAGALAALGLLAACGDDDDSENDPRIGEVGGVAENATYAYASGGPEGLYDYVADSVEAKCTVEQFAADLAGAEEPTGFRGMNGVDFEGETAKATVVQIFDDHDEDIEWVFTEESDGVWRLVETPDMGECLP